MPPTMLRFKNGVSFEMDYDRVAEVAKAAQASNVSRPIDVPLAEHWLSERAGEIQAHDHSAQNLSIEKDQISRKLDSVRSGAKLMHGTRSAMEVAAEKGQRLVQHYEDELKELDRRIKRSTDLAAQVRRAVSDFHINHPEWPQLLRDYKTAGL
jgi:hypothetical protein